MNKNNFFSIVIILTFLTMLIIIGCGKSDKNVPQNETKNETKKETQKEQLDTTKFYEFNNLQYWQNYPGKGPGNVDMVEIKDYTKDIKIKKAINGNSEMDVYTCEMHPQIHQNYMGKCPICKMDLTKVNFPNKKTQQ